MPHAPAYLPGVFHYRGKVIPVVDLGLLLGSDAAFNRLSTRIMVVRTNQQGVRLLGLLASRVSDLVRVDAAKLQPAAVQLSQAAIWERLPKLPKGLVQILNVDHVLPEHLVPEAVNKLEGPI